MLESPIKRVIEELGQAFAEFKKTNDERLAILEKKSSEPLIEDKLTRLNDVLDKATERLQKLSVLSQRPSMGGEAFSSDHKEHTRAFLNYICKGEEDSLRHFEKKTISTTPEEGGYFLPQPMVDAVYTQLEELSPMRQVASIRNTSRHQYELILPTDLNTSFWGDLLDKDRQFGTETPLLKQLVYPIFPLTANQRITASLLEDSTFNLEEWLVKITNEKFAQEENTAFIKGDGKEQPLGILKAKQSEKEEWDKLQVLKTGVNGAFPEGKPADMLINLVYTLKSKYLRNAKWMMPRSALGEIRKMKTADGHYIWQPRLSADTPGGVLWEYPVVICDDMPDLVADQQTVSILFGNFEAGYLIVDRAAISVLRDPYSAKPHVDLLIRRRVGGGALDLRAIKGLSFSV